MTMSWWSMLAVGVGGFLGANARYILATWVTQTLNRYTSWAVPYGTAFVNIIGSFLLAIFLTWTGHQTDVSQNVKLLIGTGFFGAYTTFSTYANESVALWSNGTQWTSIGYIVITNALCLVGVIAGIVFANRIGTV